MFTIFRGGGSSGRGLEAAAGSMGRSKRATRSAPGRCVYFRGGGSSGRGLEAAAGSVERSKRGDAFRTWKGASTFSDKIEQLQAWSIGIVENKRRCSNCSGVRT
jgi:hypothetical protein